MCLNLNGTPASNLEAHRHWGRVQIVDRRTLIMKKAASFKTLIFAIVLCSAAGAEDYDYYVRKGSWPETMRASREKLMQLEVRIMMLYYFRHQD